MMKNRKSEIFNKLYRKAHNGSKFWNFWYNLYTQFVLGCDIKSSTQIGEGFEIFHSSHASVVSPGTIIGKNVSLRQNTTIGEKGFNGADIESVVNEAVEYCFLSKNEKERQLTTEILVKIAKGTKSITKSCKKQIADMEALFIENDFTNATENAYWITKDRS